MNCNILHVVNIYFVIPYFFGGQLKYFKEKGYKEHVICSPSDELEAYSRMQGFAYKEIPVLRKISPYQDFKAILAICQYISRNKIGIVTGHTPKGSLLAMVAGFLMRVPKRIYFRHGLVYETSSGLKRWILKNMDRFTALLATHVVCVGPSVYKKSIVDHLNTEKKQRILFKGTCNGIDTRHFDKTMICLETIELLRTRYSISSIDFVIGFSGRLVRDKGIIELINAYEILREQKLNIILLLVGMFEERDALPWEVVEKIKKDSHIIYTGCVDNGEIEKYYALMDIFVLPSYREGFPTSILEASAMELPVITTHVTGCIDAIIADETGVFVEHSGSDLAETISNLINQKAERIRLGENGRKFVLQNFEQRLVWNDIERLYNE